MNQEFRVQFPVGDVQEATHVILAITIVNHYS